MLELKLLSKNEPRDALSDWIIRIGVAAFYCAFGLEKFSSAELHWVSLFREIGMGDWFRYFTGVVEVLGGILVLIPRTALAGLALVSATMAGAVVILLFILHRPADSVFPAIFLIVLISIGWNRFRVRRLDPQSAPKHE